MVQLLRKWGARSDLSNQCGLTSGHLAAGRMAKQNAMAERMATYRAYLSELSDWLSDAVAALETVRDRTSADRAALRLQDLNTRLHALRRKVSAQESPSASIKLDPESLLTENEMREMARRYGAFSQHVRNLERSGAFGSETLMENMKELHPLLDRSE